MPLASPRQGESRGFHLYSIALNEGTLAEPETIVWSAIRHFSSAGVAEDVAHRHGINNASERKTAGRNVKLYVRQASEFYDAARSARPNTAPLIYYYSFLNLAKALCEFRYPNFHRRSECYRHGISWTPHRLKLADPRKEKIRITTRGVWHVLWESLTNRPCPAANPTPLRIRDLFSYCPEVSVECQNTLGATLRLLYLKNPDVLYDSRRSETWMRFSVYRAGLKDLRVSLPSLRAGIRTPRSDYVEVRSTDRELRTLETATPKKYKRRRGDPLESMALDIAAFNSFVNLGPEKRLEYSIPIQGRLPLVIPQIIINYSVPFWLGSLVRYDPHSVDALMDSGYWMLIDGFTSQSRLWLLELFHWALYKAEITLWMSR
jgi:YaaC-like Protein